MAKVVFNDYSASLSGAWAGDYGSREHSVPGGAKVNPTDFTADADGVRFVQSGTLLGRTVAERDAGTGFGPVAVDGTTGNVTDTEVYLLLYDVTDASENSDCELYRHGSLVKENYLPGYATLTAQRLAAVRERYECVRGTN